MSPLFQFLAAGAGTYLIRLSGIAVAGRTGPPSASVQATLRLIAPAVLAAIVADRLFLVNERPAVQWEWWIAASVAALAALRWKSAGVTVAAGMVTVWIIAFLG